MAVRTLTYVLLGRDALSPVAHKAGRNTEASFAGMGRAASMAGLAMAAAAGIFVAESVKSAVTFQSSMEKIHTQAGASQKSVAELSKEVLKLGMYAEQSPQQLADALYHLKSVGLDDADAMKALRQASDLAAVGGADLESTTNALAGAWRSGIKGAETFGKTAATVNAIIGAGNMRMEDFTAAIGTGILPAAKTFGVSLNSMGAALALMTDEGVPAEDAATRLRMTLSLMGAPSGEASKQLAKIGLTGLQIANAMRSPGGLVSAIGLLKSHLDASGLSASRQAALLSRAFGGGRSSSAILTLISNFDVLKKKQDQINRSMGNFGPAVEAQRKTAQAQFALLKSSLDVIGVRVGSALLPPLVRFAQFLNNGALPALLNFGHKAEPVAKAVFGYFITGLSTISHGFSSLPGPVKVATLAIIALGIAMKLAAANPWTALALAIIVVVGLIVKHWKTISAVFKQVIDYIIHYWNNATGFISAKAAMVRNFVLGVWHAFANSFPGKIIIALAKFMWAMILIEFNLAKGIVIGVFKAIAAVASVTWRLVYTVLKAVWQGLISPLFTVIKVVAGALFVAIYKSAQFAWNVVSTSLRWAWTNIIKPVLMALWTTFSTVMGWILNTAARTFGWLPFGVGKNLRAAAAAFNKFKNDVNNAINGVKGRTVHVNIGMGVSTPAGAASDPSRFTRRATGGRITGPGGPRDDRAGLFALSRDEWVIQAASSNKYGYAAMDAVNKGTAVIQYRALGGAVSVSPHTPSVRSINSTIWNAVVKTVQSGWMSSVGALAGSGGNASWVSVILQALALLHQSASWLPVVMRRLMQESGGNATIVNRWDSNWFAGTPSVGGMQVIGPTFARYAGPFRNVGPFEYGVSVNKLANMYAGLNYALHAYGTLGALNRPGGYAFGGPVSFDQGGWLPPRSATMAINRTNKYERVGGDGGYTFIINITAGPLARPADIGREVVGAIKAFEKGAGKGWRS